jgi:tetratricopeptide (TPR) repeat protein
MRLKAAAHGSEQIAKDMVTKGRKTAAEARRCSRIRSCAPHPTEQEQEAVLMDTNAILWHGNEAADRGDFVAAVELFREAQSLGIPEASLNLGNAYWALEDLPHAIEAFRQGWLDGDEDAGFNLAVLLEGRGLSTARELYRALAADGYGKAAVNEALNLKDSGELEKAKQLLTPFLHDDQVGLVVAGLLGSILLKLGEEREAESLLRRAMNNDPESRAELGHLLIRQRRTDEARGVWEMGALNNEPASMVPLANLASSEGNSARSAHLNRRAYELGDAHAALNLAIDLWNEGNRHEALMWARRASRAGDGRATDWLESLENDKD